MIDKVCIICGEKFEVRKKNKRTKTCSSKCAKVNQKANYKKYQEKYRKKTNEINR